MVFIISYIKGYYLFFFSFFILYQGKDQTTVSKWCTNSSQPDIEFLMKIADVLKVDVNEILRKQ